MNPILIACLLAAGATASGGGEEAAARLAAFADARHPFIALFCSSTSDCHACMPLLEVCAKRIAARAPEARILHLLDTRNAAAARAFRRLYALRDSVLVDDGFLIRALSREAPTPFILFFDSAGRKSRGITVKSNDAEFLIDRILDSLRDAGTGLELPAPEPFRAKLAFRDTVRLTSGGEPPGFLLPVAIDYLDAAGAVSVYDLRSQEISLFDTSGRGIDTLRLGETMAASLIEPYSFLRLTDLHDSRRAAFFINDELSDRKGKFIVKMDFSERSVDTTSIRSFPAGLSLDLFGRMRYDPARRRFFMAVSAPYDERIALPTGGEAIAVLDGNGTFLRLCGRNSRDACGYRLPAPMTPILFDLGEDGSIYCCSALGDSLIRVGADLQSEMTYPLRRRAAGKVPEMPAGAESDPERFRDWQRLIPANTILTIVNRRYIALQYRSGKAQGGEPEEYFTLYDLEGRKLLEDAPIPGPVFHIDPGWNLYALDPASEHTRWLRYRILGLN